MPSRKIPITTRTPLYISVALLPVFGLAGAAEYLSQHRERTDWLTALALFALLSLIGEWLFVVFVARIESWENWALHNHGTYTRPDHDSHVVDELIGPNPEGPGKLVLRRTVHAPLMGAGRNSSWATVDLLIREDDGVETLVKSRYVWLRPPTPATMVHYLGR